MEVVVARAAALDIGKKTLTACVARQEVPSACGSCDIELGFERRVHAVVRDDRCSSTGQWEFSSSSAKRDATVLSPETRRWPCGTQREWEWCHVDAGAR